MMNHSFPAIALRLPGKLVSDLALRVKYRKSEHEKLKNDMQQKNNKNGGKREQDKSETIPQFHTGIKRGTNQEEDGKDIEIFDYNRDYHDFEIQKIPDQLPADEFRDVKVLFPVCGSAA